MKAACATIGRCVGCGKMGRLEIDACSECINRDPRWLELVRRVRSDPKFAATCYGKLKTNEERTAFVMKYGLPAAVQDGITAEIIPLRR